MKCGLLALLDKGLPYTGIYSKMKLFVSLSIGQKKDEGVYI